MQVSTTSGGDPPGGAAGPRLESDDSAPPVPPPEQTGAGHRRWLGRLLALGAVAAAVVLLRVTVLSPKPVPVTVFVAAKGRVEETVVNSKAGTIKTRRRAYLSPEVGGRVAELPVAKGSRVAAGDLLLRVYDADLRAQVEGQERAVEAAVAARVEAERAAAQARLELSRATRLANERIASAEVVDLLQSRFDMAVAARDAAGARLSQARAALAAARATLVKTEVRAPFAGIVAELSTEVGEWITPSPPGLPIPPVIQLLDPDAIYVSAPMDEVDVGKVAVGQPVRVALDAYPGRSHAGKVTRVAPYVLDVREQSRTFEIEAELDDSAFAATLRPGSSADVEVILAAREDVLRVPSYALLEGARVLLVDGSRLRAAPVRTGLENWAFTEITGGVSAGDRVVVSLDRAEVKEGAVVRVEGAAK